MKVMPAQRDRFILERDLMKGGRWFIIEGKELDGAQGVATMRKGKSYIQVHIGWRFAKSWHDPFDIWEAVAFVKGRKIKNAIRHIKRMSNGIISDSKSKRRVDPISARWRARQAVREGD